jgi:hypothetical protein
MAVSLDTRTDFAVARADPPLMLTLAQGPSSGA